MKRIYGLTLCGLCILSAQSIYAHDRYVVVEETYPAEVYVEQDPPALIVETRTASPGPAYVWINGYWKWNKDWKWVKGKWVLKPSPQASWVAGTWEKKHHHWVWKEGHWE